MSTPSRWSSRHNPLQFLRGTTSPAPAILMMVIAVFSLAACAGSLPNEAKVAIEGRVRSDLPKEVTIVRMDIRAVQVELTPWMKSVGREECWCAKVAVVASDPMYSGEWHGEVYMDRRPKWLAAIHGGKMDPRLEFGLSMTDRCLLVYSKIE
jgi:hypothetical protein